MSTRTAVAAMAVLVLTTSCGSPGSAHRWPGHIQASQFQAALERCLAERSIEYRTVVAEPGSMFTVIPMPVPELWWIHHGGWGLIDDQGGEVALDPDRVDPNESLVGSSEGRRSLERALYGQAGTPERFSIDGCYDRALREAGFREESRRGSLPPTTTDVREQAATAASVQAAHLRHRRCMERGGFSAEVAVDPEAALRRRFLRGGLIRSDGTPARGTPPDRLVHARQEEVRTALADLRCRREARVDRTLDRAIRAIAKETP